MLQWQNEQKMAQNSKKKDQTGFNPKEIASHVDDDALDLSMCNLDEVPVKDIVSIILLSII